MIPEPNLLLPWEPRWRGFLSAVRPALARSGPPLALECPTGICSPATSAVSIGLHVACVCLLILIGARVHSEPQLLRPAYMSQDDNVIYFSGPYLPALQDQGGAREGRSGYSGGQERLHREQVIRVARGTRPTDLVADAPRLKLPATLREVANLVAITPADAGPAPVESLTHPRVSPAAAPDVVPPAPAMDGAHAAVARVPDAGVVAPTPDLPQRERVKMKSSAVAAEVVPPPVSAPVREDDKKARLTLPAPTVIPPPPGVSQHEGRVMSRGGYARMTPDVVPPPSMPERGDIVGRNLAAAHAAPDVVAPPPAVNGGRHNAARFNGLGSSAEVVPPAPSLSGTSHGGGSSATLERAGSVTATLAKSNGDGRSGGTAKSAGLIISDHPGDRIGRPVNESAGAIAMSPTGHGDGLGGSGGGSGIGKGAGTGRASAGKGTGSATSSNGLGNAPNDGISASLGAGGVGNGEPSGMGGVTISGNTVTIPSFGSGGSGSTPTRGPKEGPRTSPAVTIISTSRSGGALNQYGTLKGDRVYTIYIDTRLGPAIMEYSDGAANAAFAADLTAPEPVRADFPAGVERVRLVVDCVVDRSGILRNLKVVEGAGSTMAVRMVAALHDWRFRPVLRGNEAVEVHALLGFDVDTR